MVLTQQAKKKETDWQPLQCQSFQRHDNFNSDTLSFFGAENREEQLKKTFKTNTIAESEVKTDCLANT